MKFARFAFMGAALLCACSLAVAQQTVPFAFGVPVAPTGLADQPLAAGPFLYHTAEQQDVRVTVVTRGLEYPYSMAFLPNGDLLVTERAGRLRIIRNGVLDPKPIAGAPASRFKGKSGALDAVHGYMSLVVHPRFAENHWIYFVYNKPVDEKTSSLVVARARLEGGSLTDVRDILASPELHGTASLAMTPDGMLWVATGGNDAQDPKSLIGKVLRLKDDGSVPKDNPFVGKPDYRPEIYTLGHRSSMGLTVRPGTSEVWLSEMGPNGGDEINVIKAGANYGWPTVSLGRTYPGPWQSDGNTAHARGLRAAHHLLDAFDFRLRDSRSIPATSLPKWKGGLFVGGLRYGEVPGTGRLDRVLLNDKFEELRRESLLVDLHQRIRDVKQGPDGFLYVATDEPQGAILRIEPAQ